MALGTLSTLSDAQLITAFLAGNKPAFETLLLRHKDRIYTAIYLLVKDRERAEDLFQDCFLKILTTLQSGRYNEQGKFLPWAMRVAHNLCMDFFRRRKPAVDMEKVEFLLENTDGNNDADAACEQAQTENSLRGLLEKLPAEQQKVVLLRIYGELSFKEIAEITGVSINTALGRMRYGLLNLRKMIEADPRMALR
jgi:RNA polymerase sigma-70 factor (ECF subfamily)